MSNIKKNVLYQVAYQLLVILLPFITSPYIARVLGVENIGIYSYTYSVAYNFMLLAKLGIDNYGNREIAATRDDKEKLNKTFTNIFVLHGLLSLFVLLSYVIYILFWVKENRLIAMIQGLWVMGALFDINWFYFGIEKFKITVTRNTIIKLLTVACIFIFVRKPNDLWTYCLIISAGSFVSQSLVWFFLKRYVKFVKPSWKQMKRHIKPLLVLFIPVIAVSLYKVMDKIMLGNMCTKIQLGYYENSEKAINIPLGIITAFGTVMLPKMSNLAAQNDSKKGFRYLQISMEFIMCLAIAMSFGLAGIAKEFSIVFWGNEFSECGTIIALLSITTTFIAFANIIRTQYLIPLHKDKVYIISVIGGAIINIGINAVLIPHIQAVGAAIGTVCAEGIVCLIQSFAVKKELPLLTYVKNSLFFLFLGMMMYFLIRLIGNNFGVNIITLFIEIIVGSFFYCSGCLIYFLIQKNDIIINMLNQVSKYIKKYKIGVDSNKY